MLVRLIAGMMAAGIALSGGYVPKEEILPPEVVVTIEPDLEDLSAITDEEMKIVKTVVRNRLDAAGLVDVEVEKDGKQIKVKAWDEEIEDEIVEAVMQKSGGLQFLDVDGNVLMEGNAKNIESAKAAFGPIDAYGNAQHYVTVYFTDEGRAAFKAATEAVVGKIAEGGNYISIVVDGTVYSNPAVYEVIDADSCMINGSFDKETAAEMANVINSGLLEFDLRIVE